MCMLHCHVLELCPRTAIPVESRGRGVAHASSQGCHFPSGAGLVQVKGVAVFLPQWAQLKVQEAYSGLPADGENPLLLDSNHQAGEKCPAVGADLMVLLLGYSLSLETQGTETAGITACCKEYSIHNSRYNTAHLYSLQRYCLMEAAQQAWSRHQQFYNTGLAAL